MKLLCLLSCLFLTACAGSAYEAQTRTDAKEITIEGRVIRVIDLGNKVQMIRKGYLHFAPDIEHWEDFIFAGEKVTGCKIENLVPKPGARDTLVWVEAIKKC